MIIPGGIDVTDYVVVSAKVPRELKEKAKRYGINLSELFRKALKDEIEKKMLLDIKKRKRRIKEILDRIPDERVIETVREARENR